MKIKLNGKEYESGKIVAAVQREAILLNADTLELASEAPKLQERSDVDAAGTLMQRLLDLTDRRAALICRAFGGQFSAEELLDAYTTDEMNAIVTQIVTG